MRSATVLAGLATVLAPLASAHTVLTTVFVNDKNQGDGTGVRMPMDGNIANAPVINMNSDDMICGESWILSHSCLLLKDTHTSNRQRRPREGQLRHPRHRWLQDDL